MIVLVEVWEITEVTVHEARGVGVEVLVEGKFV